MRNRGCKKPGCTNSHFNRGYCRPHYCKLPKIKKKRKKYQKEYYKKPGIKEHMNKIKLQWRNKNKEKLKSIHLKTSLEWQTLCNVIVLDPDGWDREAFQYSWYTEKITREEFERRLCLSTHNSSFDFISGNIWNDTEMENKDRGRRTNN